MNATPSIAVLVSALIVDAEGRVLLTSHGPSWKWHLPDGDVAFGETFRGALIRCVRDDLSIVIDPESRPFLVSETIGSDGNAHYLTLHFRASLPSSQTPTAKAGLRSGFYGRADVGTLKIYRATSEALRLGLGWT